MKCIKSYCGKMIMESNEEYIYVDAYSSKILKKGTLEECMAEFNKYIERVMDRD